MPKSPEKKPWAERIRHLRTSLGDNQQEFAQRMNTAQQTVSLWEKGERKRLSAETFIRLGNLAPYPDCLWFWEQAGLNAAKVLPALKPEFEGKTATAEPDEIVHLKVLGEAGSKRVTSRQRVTLPAAFVPNPETSVCIRLSKGSVLSPLKGDGFLVVDVSQHEQATLTGRMVALECTKGNAKRPEGIYVGWFWVIPVGNENIPILTTIDTQESLSALMRLDVHLPAKNKTEIIASLFEAALAGGDVIPLLPASDWMIVGAVTFLLSRDRGREFKALKK